MDMIGITSTVIYAGIGGAIVVILLFMVVFTWKTLNIVREIGETHQFFRVTQKNIEEIQRRCLKTQIALEDSLKTLCSRHQLSSASVIQELKITRTELTKEMSTRDKDVSERFEKLTNLSLDIRDFYAALRFIKEGIDKSALLSGNLGTTVEEFSSSVHRLGELVVAMEHSIRPVKDAEEEDPIERLNGVLQGQNQLLERILSDWATQLHHVVSDREEKDLKMLETLSRLEEEISSFMKLSETSLEQIRDALKQISANTKRRFF